MPRKPRVIHPGAIYHMISRFVDRDWYIQREVDRDRYLHLLARALDESDWRCLAYAVMSNHIHNLLVAGSQPLHSWIRRVHAPFADALNHEFDRIGSVFVRGPKQIDVPMADVGRVIAYIHNNPVRAGVVTQPEATTWTSHRAYLGLVDVPGWLHPALGLQHAGVAAESFGSFVTGDHVAFERRYDALVHAPDDTRARAQTPYVEPESLVIAVADELQIPLTQLCSPRRGPAERMGREIAARCAAELGLTAVALARAMRVTQQAVSLMQRRAENDDALGVRLRVLGRLRAG